MASSPSDALALLASADLAARGFLANASNHTVLVTVGDPADGVHGVYKPMRGERPLWDFPGGTLHRREVAAYVVSDHLGWDLVPPTVLRDGPFGEGSVQLFVVHDPRRHYFVLVEEEVFHPELARMAYFDLLINNADRKGSHILHDADAGRLVGIDHGVAFHELPKLRTVVWDLPGTPVPVAWRDDVGALIDAICRTGDLRRELDALLLPTEIDALVGRAERLVELAHLPEVPDDRRAYPWPPL